MRRIAVILLIALCLLAAVLPAAAAKDETGKAAGIAGQPDTSRGNADGKNTDAPGTEAPGIRETIKKELRVQNETGRPGTPELNRTGKRDENHPGTGFAGNTSRNGSGTSDTIRNNRTEQTPVPGNASPVRAGWTRNPNEVRLAVHTLLAMENRTGGIGPQVSAIARDFNNSAQKTYQLEERIQSRDAFSRFLFGGDKASAAELANLTVQNENRIRQIEQLMNGGTLDPDTRIMLEEQLRILNEENTRLAGISVREQQDKGLFGWIGS